MDLSRPVRKPKMNTDSLTRKKSKFEVYFPYFDKTNNKQQERNRRKIITKKNRCESVQSTNASYKRSTTPILNHIEHQNSGYYFKKTDTEEKPRLDRRNQSYQKSPKSFVIKPKENTKYSDLSYDISKIYGNRKISSLSRKNEEDSKENLQDLSKYFEDFYEKSRLLLQKFEQNMKKGKLLNVD